MARNRVARDPLPDDSATIEELAEFWELHDVTDYDDILTSVDMTVSDHLDHEYVITLSVSLDEMLRRIQRIEGVSRSTLVNLWVQERLQQYVLPVMQ